MLAINETHVVRARLRATREGGGERSSCCCGRARTAAFDPSAREWLALVRPGRKLRAGARLRIGDAGATIVEVLDDGPRVVRFDDGVDVGALLDAHGELPLPPYVGTGDTARAERYQTVFARVPGQRRRADGVAALHARACSTRFARAASSSRRSCSTSASERFAR